MRLWAFVVSCVIVFDGSLPGFAQQQQTGPATLENLLGDEVTAPTQRPVAVDATDPAATAVPAGRIHGAIARPKDGVQHPDIDAAWAEYDKQIETAAQAIEQAIEKELNAAAAAGDLDAALIWKTAGEQFRKDGRIPEGLDGQKPQGRSKPRPAKSESSPQSLVVDAQGRLARAYEAVEKELVKSLDLEKAKQVRSERESLAPAGGNSAPAPLLVVIEAKNYKAASPNAAPQRDGTGVAIREAARWDNLTIPADSTLLWDVALPQQGNFFVHVLYASGEARPCDVVVNGKIVARSVLGGNTGGFMRRNLKWETLGPVAFGLNNQLSIDPQIQSPHLSRIVISSGRETPGQNVLTARLSKHRYLKVIISPQGQRQELTEMFEFYGQGEIRVNGKPVSMKWQPIGEDGIRLEIGKPHGHVVLRMNADDSLVGRNEGRSDGAVWGWELLPQGVAVANQNTESLAGRWAAGPDDPYVRVIEPQGRVREFDRRTEKEMAAGALRRLDDGRYEAVMSNGFTVYWRLLAGDRAEFHAMDRAGKMQDKVVLKKQ
jgi:hypothetical protein